MADRPLAIKHRRFATYDITVGKTGQIRRRCDPQAASTFRAETSLQMTSLSYTLRTRYLFTSSALNCAGIITFSNSQLSE